MWCHTLAEGCVLQSKPKQGPLGGLKGQGTTEDEEMSYLKRFLQVPNLRQDPTEVSGQLERCILLNSQENLGLI